MSKSAESHKWIPYVRQRNMEGESMKTEIRKITKGEKTHAVLTYTLYPDDQITKEALKYAEKSHDDVSVFSPEGRPRDKNERLQKCFGGALAENVVRHHLSEILGDEGPKPTIKSNMMVHSTGQDIDVSIVDEGVSIEIEVRSSFSYRTTFERLFTGAFSIIGPYTTSTKPSEEPKDYYITVVYHSFRPSEIFEKLEKDGIEIHICGGAPQQVFFDRKQKRTLKQSGADYFIINPIIEALDYSEIDKMILAEFGR